MSRFDRWLDLFSVVPSSNSRPLFFISTLIINITCSFPSIPLCQLCVLSLFTYLFIYLPLLFPLLLLSLSTIIIIIIIVIIVNIKIVRIIRITMTWRRRRRTRRTGEGGETNQEIVQSNRSASRYWYIWDFILRYRVVVSWDWRHLSCRTITASAPTRSGQNPSQSLRHLGPVSSKGPETFRARRRILKSNPVEY